MLILDLSTNRFSETDADLHDSYPDELLQTEWNPVLAEIQPVQPSSPEPWKPAPAVIDAALTDLS